MTSKSADAALVAGARAARAADGLVRGDVIVDLEAVVAHLLGGHDHFLLAAVAQPAREALGDDGVDRRGDEERLDAHVDQARDGGRRVVGVQRGEHEVAGERGLDRDLAVSWSRISPTMMMSGSARIIERRPLAKVRPCFGVDLRSA